jgi:replicative superfamily II helicase
MATRLFDFIPPPGETDGGLLLDRFLSYVDARALTLYPAQESAILELFEDKNVILNTPTGSGRRTWA